MYRIAANDIKISAGVVGICCIGLALLEGCSQEKPKAPPAPPAAVTAPAATTPGATGAKPTGMAARERSQNRE